MLKRPVTKFQCPVAKDCTERLSAVALSLGLIIPRGLCVSGHVARVSFFSQQIRHRNALPKIPWEDAVQGIGMATSTVASEGKQKIVVYRQSVLQTVTSLRVVSLVFRGQDPQKITNINPQQEARFSLWKNLILRESGGNGA